MPEHVGRIVGGPGPWALALALALALAGTAGARTWRVEKDGRGDFRVIQAAVDAASVGDTIRIGVGEYTESRVWEYDPGVFGEVFVGVSTNDLTLIGAHRDSVVIGPVQKNWDEWNFLPKGIALKGLTADGLRVENLTVRNAREGLRLNGNAIVRTVTLVDNGTSVVSTADTFSVEDCLILRSVNTGVGVAAAAKRSYVRRTRFIDCTQGALSLNGPTLVIEDSEFRNGAVYAEAQFGSRLELYRCVGLGSLNAGLTAKFDSDLVVESCRLAVRSQVVGLTAGSRGVIRDSHLRSQLDVCVVTTERSQPTVNNCDLIAELRGTYAVYLGLTVAQNPLLTWDFRGNWWGTSDPDSIAYLVWDRNDDPRIDETVDFSNWRTGPVPTRRATVGGLKAGYR